MPIKKDKTPLTCHTLSNQAVKRREKGKKSLTISKENSHQDSCMSTKPSLITFALKLK